MSSPFKTGRHPISKLSLPAVPGMSAGRENFWWPGRYPIGQVTPLDFAGSANNAPKAERGAAACFELLAPAGPINLINVHLASPHSGLLTMIHDHGNALAENIQRRWSESEMLRDLVEHTPEPVLLAGDFNTTDDSPIFREHWADFTDAFAERGFGFGYTYLIDHTQLRIDHILTSQSWKPIQLLDRAGIGFTAPPAPGGSGVPITRLHPALAGLVTSVAVAGRYPLSR